MAYKYITDNNLYKKQTYMYSEYRGETFIKEYIDSRRKRFGASPKDIEEENLTDIISTPVRQDLGGLCEKLRGGEHSDEVIRCINGYVKSFEVRKRLYSAYDSDWKPIVGTGFEDYESYLLFADCLLWVYQYTKCLKYFSCLLKVDDTLLSLQNRLNQKEKKSLECIVSREMEFFYRLVNENNIVMEMIK